MRNAKYIIAIGSLALGACGQGQLVGEPGGSGETVTTPGTTASPGAPSQTADPVANPTTNSDSDAVVPVDDGSGDSSGTAQPAADPSDPGTSADPADPADPAADPVTPADPAEPVDPGTAPNLGQDIDMEASLAAFQTTVYPILQANCSTCHSSDGAGRKPLHSDSDVNVAHENALTKVNLRETENSRLVQRLLTDLHNCWSDCADNGAEMLAAVNEWAAAVPTAVPDTPVADGQVTDAQVVQWINDDKATFSAEDQQYLRYTSLHTLYNLGANPDDMNVARVGLSKVLNSTALETETIINPEPVDPYFLVYRFDVRDYWGHALNGGFNFGGGGFGGQQQDQSAVNAQAALDNWDRIIQGNINVSSDDTQWADMGSPPNVDGFYADYVEATQLAYTLSRPDVYNELMNIGIIATQLEDSLGIQKSLGEGRDYKFMTVDEAITIGKRLMWRGDIDNGYYWRSVDQFSFEDFVFYNAPVPTFTNQDWSQIVTTPVDGVDGAQAQANETIAEMKNGLQMYGIFGAGNQRRVDAFTFIVVDPQRGGAVPEAGNGFGGIGGFRSGEGADWRLLNGASCMGCHMEGMNYAQDDMNKYIAANPSVYDAALMDQVRQYYPGDSIMGPLIEADRNSFLNAMAEIQTVMIQGTTDKNVRVEPIQYLFQVAQSIYGYPNTISN